MTFKKDLEDTIKEKVTPLLDEMMEQNLGLYIPKVSKDISDKLANPLTLMYIPFELPFQTAKKKFKTAFLKKELALHLGNITNVAKSLGLDRRSIHRAIKELEIDIYLTKKIDYQQEHLVDETIRETLDNYRNIFKAEKMEKIYQEVPALSKHIAKILPHQDFTWKEVEQEFEKQFLENVLKNNHWNINSTAKKISLRAETLYRKIKKLGLQKVD